MFSNKYSSILALKIINMEIWDLYDKNYNLTGESLVRGNPVPEGRYHLVIHFWLINSKGEHLIQKRSELTTGGQGKWALTGGSALKGENSRQAVIREVGEEIGSFIDDEDELIKLSSTHRENFILDIWYLKKDVLLENFEIGEEVSAVKYASEKEVRRLVETEEFWYYHESYIDQMFELASEV